MTADYLNEMLLFEERGVGAYKYKDVIDDICNYCEYKTHDLYYTFFIRGMKIKHFNVEKKLTNKIDFIDNLEIMIIPRFVSSYKNTGEHGRIITYDDSKIENDKLHHICIEIILQLNNKNGIMYGQSFYNTLYHELNHAYQMYCSMKHDRITRLYDSQPSVVEHIKDVDKTELRRKVFTDGDAKTLKLKSHYFSYLLYAIFDKFEFNAKIAGLYGDLKTLYHKDASLSEILEKTEAYKTYRNIYDTIDGMVYLLTPNEFEAMMNVLRQHGVTKIWKTKESFLTQMKSWLNTFLKKIGKVASLYYDELKDNSDVDSTVCFINYSMPRELKEQLERLKREKLL